MEDFVTLKVKLSIAKKFRVFAKKLSISQSETLLVMVAFFENNKISPYEDLGLNIKTVSNKIEKRSNAIIAIMKSIEKSQNGVLINIETMLLSLFEADYKEKGKKRVTQKRIEVPKEDKLETTIPIYKYNHLKRKLDESQAKMKYLLESIKSVNNRLGNDFLKIEITREELVRYKRALKE